MKRKLMNMMVIVCVVALCATLFVACGNSLAAPSNFQYSNGTLSWDAVEGADGYMVRVNEGSEFFVAGTSVTVDDSNVKGSLVANETNTLYVMAVLRDENGEILAKSKLVTFDFDFVAGTSTQWKVTFNLNYEGAPEAKVVSVNKGEKVSKPSDPKRTDWKFEGWYRDTAGLMAFEFGADGKSVANITSNTDLYAKWSEDKSSPENPDDPINPDDPTDPDVDISEGVFIQVGNNTPEELTLNGEASGEEYMISIYLNVGDSVVITVDGVEVDNYENSEDFNGTAKAAGYHDFYVKIGEESNSIWVKVPSGPVIGESEYVLLVNGTDEYEMTALASDDPNVTEQYTVTVTLNANDTVRIFNGSFEFINYEPECGFKGTATVDGDYTFYAKRYLDDGDSVYVATPEGFGPTIPGGSVVLIVNGTDEHAMTVLPSDDVNVILQYTVTLELKAGDTVRIFDGDFEFIHYEEWTPFRGTATVDGSYTFYAKRWQDGGDSVYVAVPTGFETPTPEGGAYAKVGNGEPQAMTFQKGDYGDEYKITLTLNVGDTVVFTLNGETIANYENPTVFNGKATKEGSYTFYLKTSKIIYSEYSPKSSGLTTTKTTVYFYNDQGWSEVYAYYWDSAVGNTNWPGVKMQSIGNGWYMLEIEAGYDMIIFNAGNNKPQSGNLALEPTDGVAYYDKNGLTDKRPN